jgi:hypothetical protein
VLGVYPAPVAQSVAQSNAVSATSTNAAIGLVRR